MYSGEASEAEDAPSEGATGDVAADVMGSNGDIDKLLGRMGVAAEAKLLPVARVACKFSWE